MKLSTRLLALPALAAALSPAAFASAKPSIIVVHRNIHNVQDESNWLQLQRTLTDDGYTAVSVALGTDETAAEGKDILTGLIQTQSAGHPVLLVGTASVSDAVTLAAEAAPEKVQGEVYISSADAIPSFGPRDIVVPADLAARSVQVRITRGKFQQATEGGATIYRVREEGRSTLPKLDDLAEVIESVSTRKPTKA